jgi:hypothetical protein
MAVFLILASLTAAYLQVRQTNKIAKAELTNSSWMQNGSLYLTLYDTHEKAEFIARALSDATQLTPAEDLQMSAALGVVLGGHEASFMLRRRGLIEDYASKAADQVSSR